MRVVSDAIVALPWTTVATTRVSQSRTELEVVSVVWARSVLVTEAALPLVLARAGKGGEEMAA